MLTNWLTGAFAFTFWYFKIYEVVWNATEIAISNLSLFLGKQDFNLMLAKLVFFRYYRYYLVSNRTLASGQQLRREFFESPRMIKSLCFVHHFRWLVTISVCHRIKFLRIFTNWFQHWCSGNFLQGSSHKSPRLEFGRKIAS